MRREESEMIAKIVWARGDERQRVGTQCQSSCRATFPPRQVTQGEQQNAVWRQSWKSKVSVAYSINPILIRQVYWHNKIPCQRGSPVFARRHSLCAQGSAFCTQLSPGPVSFLEVAAAIGIVLRLCPSPKDREGVLGRNPEQSICLIIPSLFAQGGKPTCRTPLHCRKENCRLKKNCCQWMFGQGNILQWEVPGHAMTRSPDYIWAAIVL